MIYEVGQFQNYPERRSIGRSHLVIEGSRTDGSLSFCSANIYMKLHLTVCIHISCSYV
jgi:hypothetical protein